MCRESGVEVRREIPITFHEKFLCVKKESLCSAFQLDKKDTVVVQAHGSTDVYWDREYLPVWPTDASHFMVIGSFVGTVVRLDETSSEGSPIEVLSDTSPDVLRQVFSPSSLKGISIASVSTKQS